MQYNVKIDAFEGPLDLLLHLINRYEIDIYDIPVATITEQYVSYIHAMQELQLDVASEFLVMAATLLAMKSKMLLPKHEEEWSEDGEELTEDPRQELMERLIEYKKYKEAAMELKEREGERAQLFTRPPADLSPFQGQDSDERMPLDVTLYDMLAAFQKLMRRKTLQRPITTTITRQEISIEAQMDEVMKRVRLSGGRQRFVDLFGQDDREAIVVTFLAVLELMKKKLIIIEQERNFDEIYVFQT
ncbi:segregation/condensation protein A [Ectobacillus funiculus]|uniref:segregation/condensation protein A n=1 Tax=Ectobacillus funiculus TaxID=137993 RepID=UPI0039783C49